jgi:hypothetical protein
MNVHIEDGKYQIKQNGKEAGKLVVSGGVEYYYLYLEVPAGSSTLAVYTVPTNELATPPSSGKFASASVVTFDFVREGNIEAGFSLSDYVTRNIPANVRATPIVATSDASIALSDVPPVSGQIDWGTFRIEQVFDGGDVIVGYLDVTMGRLPRESWYLYDSGGSHAVYRAPGAGGGRYTVHALGKSSRLASDLLPTGAKYTRVDFDCSTIPVIDR